MFSMDSWWWKFAIIAAIVTVREFVRYFAAPPAEVVATDAVVSDALVGTGEISGGTAVVPPAATQIAPRDNEAARGVIEILDSAAIAFGLVFFVVQPFILQPFYIPSGSMEDTLQYRPASDRLLVAKWVYHWRDPQFQDIVVFKPPGAAHPRPGDDYIKRLIGEPGDTVMVQNRQYFRKARGANVFVKLQEPYVKWSNENMAGYDMKVVGGKVYWREYTLDGRPGLWEEQGSRALPPNTDPPFLNQDAIQAAAPEPVPAGQYLVLGDHRNASSDSHEWGFVPRRNFIGKAMCVFWPPHRIGTLDNMSQSPAARANSLRTGSTVAPSS